MIKAQLEELLNTNLTYQQIAEKLGYSQASSTMYYIKKYNINSGRKVGRETKEKDGKKTCKTCRCELPISKFGKNSSGYSKPSCKKCQRNKTRKLLQNKKIQAIEYKGGVCQECGYNKCPASFDFHHLNPNKKESRISTLLNDGSATISQSCYNELDKCQLLCANCHREVHEKLESE